MPNTPDHKVAMYQLARERRTAGLPVWDRKINLADVFHNEAMTFEQRRDAIVARLYDSGWLKDHGEDDGRLDMLVEELGDTETPDDFDAVMGEIYDEADYDRVWIGTV